MKQIKQKNRHSKGFTLIELLIVIAILAILSVVVVLTLNPAELLRQARDSTRISDLSTIKSALLLYLADSATSTLADASSATRCYISSTSTAITANCGARHPGTTATSTTPTNINGSGWVGGRGTVNQGPNLNDIGSGAPLSVWPMDPLLNNATSFYSYAADTTAKTFEINAKMESIKYSRGGGADIESTDGGNKDGIYEVGSAPGLSL